MILIPILALLIGLAVGFLFKSSLPPPLAVYLAAGVVAGLDTVLGGVRSSIEQKFRTDVFVTGFVANVLIAYFLAWFGDKIGVNVYLAAILVMGTRIFTNLSLIRRHLLTKWHDARERRRLDAEAKQMQAESEAESEAKVQQTVTT